MTVSKTTCYFVSSGVSTARNENLMSTLHAINQRYGRGGSTPGGRRGR